MNEEDWYAAKCVFQHTDLAEQEGQTTYEERIVLLRASSFEEATTLGEAEAEAYAQKLNGSCCYCGFIDVFHLLTSTVGPESEVYSLMRHSSLKPDEFLDRYYDDGSECSQDIEGTGAG